MNNFSTIDRNPIGWQHALLAALPDLFQLARFYQGQNVLLRCPDRHARELCNLVGRLGAAVKDTFGHQFRCHQLANCVGRFHAGSLHSVWPCGWMCSQQTVWVSVYSPQTKPAAQDRVERRALA